MPPKKHPAIIIIRNYFLKFKLHLHLNLTLVLELYLGTLDEKPLFAIQRCLSAPLISPSRLQSATW